MSNCNRTGQLMLLDAILLLTSPLFTIVLCALILMMYEESLALASDSTKRRKIRGWREGGVELFIPLFCLCWALWVGCVPLVKAVAPIAEPSWFNYSLSSGNCSLLSSQKYTGNYDHQPWAATLSLYLTLFVSHPDNALCCLTGLWRTDLW